MMRLPVLIVGAGPYGLSLAANLRRLGIPARTFGKPMHPWRSHMPPGMLLKSGTDASDLLAPGRAYPLSAFYHDNGLPFSRDVPIPVDRFVEYGTIFQRRFVPEVDTREVVAIQRKGDRFEVTLSNSEVIPAGRVVLAVGIYSFKYLPRVLRGFEPHLVSHSAEYGAITSLLGRTTAIIGAGASAIDLAVALHAASVPVSVIARRASIGYHAPPQAWCGVKSYLQQLRNPTSPIGTGWRVKVFAHAPGLIHRLPAEAKWNIAHEYLGPAPGWFMRDRTRNIPVLTGQTIRKAEKTSAGICLHHHGTDGVDSRTEVNHVVAATGYRVDLAQLRFLSDDIITDIATVSSAPRLSRSFETSVPGLYMIGPSAAPSFGPVMRFVYGVNYTTRQLAGILSATAGSTAAYASRVPA